MELFAVFQLVSLALITHGHTVMAPSALTNGLGVPKIDMHTHIYPAWYADEVRKAGWDQRAPVSHS